MEFRSDVITCSGKYSNNQQKLFSYGTAGFRTKADDLETVLFRMGLLAALRSKAKKAHIGLMITASHNPACDNGVKLVDPYGEMMVESWEAHATHVANASDDELAGVLHRIVTEEHITADHTAQVVIGRDTRPSSNTLHAAAVSGVEALGGKVIDCGVVTTPLLHYRVRCANDPSYGVASNEGYTDKLVETFLKLQSCAQPATSCAQPATSCYCQDLLFDGANGVGGLQMAIMAPRISQALKLTIHNGGEGQGVLNYRCGADFVKVSQSWPSGVPATPGSRCVSVDGDADRVVYSYMDELGAYHLMDGDKIATLVVGFLQEQLSEAGLALRLGLVQTAYANGASTAYVNDSLKVPVGFAKTGVKHLHHMALSFDIGVYFEANGHGTVIFSDSASAAIKEAASTDSPAARRLAAVKDLINETVGDAISDLLLVEVILRHRGWGMRDWDAQYHDMPNKLVTVRVADRSVFETTDAERRCTQPAALQPAIDDLLSTSFLHARARTFVRPSGTEDLVRVYAEAATQSHVEELALQVSRLVFDLAGGVGERP